MAHMRMRISSLLADTNPETVPLFSFDGLDTVARVTRVVDGDTCHVMFEYLGTLVRVSARLWGINCPETRTRDADEKRRGKAATQRLKELLEDQSRPYYVRAEFLGNDKYGRTLARLRGFDTDRCINEQLVEEGHAVEYMR